MDSSSTHQGNAATDAAFEYFHLHGDREFLLSIREDPTGYYRPDLIRVDRRRVIGAPRTGSVMEFVDHALHWFDLSDEQPVFRVEEVVAVRGDRCGLIRCAVSYGESVTRFLNAFRTTPGAIRPEVDISVLFDVDDRESAIAELDRLHAEIKPTR